MAHMVLLLGRCLTQNIFFIMDDLQRSIFLRHSFPIYQARGFSLWTSWRRLVRNQTFMSLIAGLTSLIRIGLRFWIAQLEKVNILVASVVLLVVACRVLTRLGWTIIELFIILHDWALSALFINFVRQSLSFESPSSYLLSDWTLFWLLLKLISWVLRIDWIAVHFIEWINFFFDWLLRGIQNTIVNT